MSFLQLKGANQYWIILNNYKDNMFLGKEKIMQNTLLTRVGD